jgi:thioesterase domain-containing protein
MSAATGRDTSLMLVLAPPRGRRGAVLLHPAGGGVSPYFGPASALAKRGGAHAIRAGGLLPGEEPDDDLPTMVRRYIPLLDGLARPPTLLFRWSMGGVLGPTLLIHCADDHQFVGRWRELAPVLPIRTVRYGHFELFDRYNGAAVLRHVEEFLDDVECGHE